MKGRGAPPDVLTDWPLPTAALPCAFDAETVPSSTVSIDLVGLDADHELGALHRGVQIGRVDLERARLPAEGLECAFRQIEQRRLLLVGGDVGEMHRRVLVDAQHGFIDEHDRSTAERARAHRVLRAKRLIESCRSATLRCGVPQPGRRSSRAGLRPGMIVRLPSPPAPARASRKSSAILTPKPP